MMAEFVSVRSEGHASSLSQGWWGHWPLVTVSASSEQTLCPAANIPTDAGPRQAFPVPKSRVEAELSDILILCNKALLFFATSRLVDVASLTF